MQEAGNFPEHVYRIEAGDTVIVDLLPFPLSPTGF